MGAGLPLFILSCLAILILVVWARNGKGKRKIRIYAASIILSALFSYWVALLSVGVFHPVGTYGMALGFVVSICSFFVPAVGNKISRHENS